jgi:lipopolysaccharide/colanic/teichoic acid biosynthesis glycosyltransferase
MSYPGSCRCRAAPRCHTGQSPGRALRAGRRRLLRPPPGEAGITGLAPINGWRGETGAKEKIEQRVLHGLDYIDQSSLGDLYILAKTPLALLKTQNAC